MNNLFRNLTAALVALAVTTPLHAQETARIAAPTDDTMRLTLLGTGSPALRIERFGFANLVQAGGLNLLFDAGRGATMRLGQMGLPIGAIDATFLTHFHSDHTNGLPDVYLSGYVPLPLGGRQDEFQLYGPEGVQQLAEGLMLAYASDVVERGGAKIPEAATKIAAHVVDEGVVFERNGVKVEAFRVFHHKFSTETFGYRVSYGDHSVVISGDASHSESVASYGKGADIIVHEVAAVSQVAAVKPFFKVVMSGHTSPEEAARIFTAAQPKLAIFSHVVQLPGGHVGPSTDEILTRTRAGYDGEVIIGEDLMSFVISDDGIERDVID